MKIKRKIYTICHIILSTLFVGCYSAGTLGSGEIYQFEFTKHELLKKIDLFFKMNPTYNIPEDFKYREDYLKKNYDFLDIELFYFNSEPKEIYVVSTVNNGGSFDDSSSPSFLSVRSIIDIKSNQNMNLASMSEKEKKRIDERFKAIIKKIKNI